MPTPMDNLDHDATLMLYLADEMTPAQREAFERRLSAEARLAAELAALRGAESASYDAMRHADAHLRLSTNESVAVRRVSRSIQQWQTRRMTPTAAQKKYGLPLPWWCYPVAAAASVIIAFLVWSSRQEVQSTDPVVDANQIYDQMQDMEQIKLADWMDTTLVMDTDASGSAGGDAILDDPLQSGRTDDLNSIFLMPPSEETIQ